MDRLLNSVRLKDILYGCESVGSLQDYAERIRQLHHQYLKIQLGSESETLPNFEELSRFAEDAEFLATQYTNPLVVEKTEGIPPEEVPNLQLVQDALALSGTIFEFLGDIVSCYEKQGNCPRTENFLEVSQDNLDIPEIHQQVGKSSVFYFKSALCYGLGLYECRTQVILKRLLENLRCPNVVLSLKNREQWVCYLVSTLLSRDIHSILQSRQFLQRPLSLIREELKLQMAKNSLLSLRHIFSVEASLALIEVCIVAAEAFLYGKAELISTAYERLSHAAKSVYQLGDYELLWIINTWGKVLRKMWNDSPWVRLAGVM